MFQSQLPKRSNIFDDHHHLHPDKLHKYRNADLLDLMSFSKSGKSSLEKLQNSSVSPVPKVLTQEVNTSKTWSLNIPNLDQSVLTPIKTQNAQNVHMENSAAITQVPPTEASLNKKSALSSASDTHEQEVPKRLSTIFEEESSSQESLNNVENNEEKKKTEEVKDVSNNLLDGVKGFAPINLKDIKLDTSINFQFKKIEFPLVASLKTSEEEGLKTVENQQQDSKVEKEEKDEGTAQDDLEKIQGIIPYDYNELQNDHPEEFVPESSEAVEKNIAAPVTIKVETEDRGVDACDFMTVEKEEQEVQAAPVLVDKVVDTAELRFEEEKEKKEENVEKEEKEEKEEVIKEDKAVDTSQLITMQDEFTETIELGDDERKKSIEEVKVLKFKFLGELHGLRNKLDLIKQDQADSKQGTSESLKETIKSVSEFVRAGLEKYIKEKSQKQIKNLRAYQVEVSQTKNELEKLKSFVQFTAEKMKEKIAVYFNNEGKKLLEKLIDDSQKEKVRQFVEMLGDTNSVTTDSSHVTPCKTPSKATPSKPRQSYIRRRPHKLDPAVIEGLAYLFDLDALRNPLGSDKESEKAFKEKLRKILKTNEADKKTSEFLLETLMDRSSRKKAEKSESRAPSESPEKRKRKKSLHGDEDDENDDDMSDLKSVRSERGGLSTPGKGSTRKQAKRDFKTYKSFVDENGDKVFVVPEDLEREQNA